MDEQVLIVGAGPVGMLLACELLAQGVEVRLVDAAREHSAHSRATIIWPRLLELLRHTDITDRLVDCGHPLDGVSYFSHGRPLGTAWMNRLTDTPYPFALGIRQSQTEEIIEGRLAELGGKIEHGLRLTEIRDAGGPRPVAVLAGPAGEEEVETQWLIGADGAHSSVRKLAGASFEGAEFDVSFAVTDAEVMGDVPLNVLSYCYSPEGSLAFAPLGGGISRVAVSVPHTMDGTTPSREFYQSIVDERAPGQNLLGELRFSTVFRVHARIAASFRIGHCLLVGDAAHIMSPAGAQGMNTGLQDAVNLGWRLGGVLRGQLSEQVLDGYDRERRNAAHAVARTTTLQTDWGLLRRRFQIAARDVVVGAASASGMLQRALAPLVAQTGVRYPAVTPGRLLRESINPRRRTQPGERLPVLPVASDSAPAGEVQVVGQTWLAVPSDRFTVLRWPGDRTPLDWAELGERVRVLAGPEVAVVDARYSEGAAARALGRAPALAVVRPDGYLVATVDPSQPDAPHTLRSVLATARRG